MKLKSLPDDFRVEEITRFRPSRGPFAFYKLEKRGIGTPEAISAILRDWNLSRKSVGYGGLKDRHAVTTQYITIHGGPNIHHEDRSYRLEYLGQAHRQYDAKDIEANKFEICLRDLPREDHAAIQNRCDSVAKVGIVNYFDDQRFGSIGYSGDLIGAAWCKANYERALYLALAEENSHDRGREREQKEILRKHWGEWPKLKDLLDRSSRRSIICFLIDHPTDFKRAVALVRQDMRSIYLAAFQSWVWNRWLSSLIDAKLPDAVRTTIPSRCGPLSIPLFASNHGELGATAGALGVKWLQDLVLPLPSARQKEWNQETLPYLVDVLKPLDMEVREMRLKYPRDTFFSKGHRNAWLSPKNFSSRWENDETHNQRLALNLAFELPKGCYATMIIRAIATQDFDDFEESDSPESTPVELNSMESNTAQTSSEVFDAQTKANDQIEHQTAPETESDN